MVQFFLKIQKKIAPRKEQNLQSLFQMFHLYLEVCFYHFLPNIVRNGNIWLH